MEKRKLNGKEIVQDICGGMNDAALMKKYSLSQKGLHSALTKLVAGGMLKQAVLDERASAHKRAVNLTRKCPSCAKPQAREFDERSAASATVERFPRKQTEKLSRETERQSRQENTRADDLAVKKALSVPLHFCSKCVLQLMEESDFCPSCGSRIAACGVNASAADGEEPKPGKHLISGQTSTQLLASNRTYASASPYYRNKFMEFDENGGKFKPTWNWAAFLLGPIWYLLRGIWLKAILAWMLAGSVMFFALLSAESVDSAMLAICLSILLVELYFALCGNYDYYLSKVKNIQGYGPGGHN